LARISSAIAVITAQITPVPTLIFDEVDSGIGGAVAEVVGRLLRRLGQTRQVLCVTHLPQVAACANQQWLVHKHTEDGVTTSTLTPLTEEERVGEIARMMGGRVITDATLKTAGELIESAKKADE
ncbi:MAG: DNA repair protein RecN, partial [Sutterellaceae bacterium]|nr:DNA repair protein RecN [Sutterellaceae bacterium]